MHIVAGIDPGYLCVKIEKQTMTRKEIIEIEQNCSVHKVSKKSRLAELGIPFWNFYKARRKYRHEDELIGTVPSTGKFIQLPTLSSAPAMQPSRRMSKNTASKDAEPIVVSYLTIELRIASGTAMRIQSDMISLHLRELISASHVLA
jgi:hypothetical protein